MSYRKSGNRKIPYWIYKEGKKKSISINKTKKGFFFLGKEMEKTSNLYPALWLFVNFGTFLSSRARQMQPPAENK